MISYSKNFILLLIYICKYLRIEIVIIWLLDLLVLLRVVFIGVIKCYLFFFGL